MKKILAILLAALLALTCVALAEEKIALVTDIGGIDDESFNQACWEGVVEFATANNLEYQYYKPDEDSHDSRMIKIDTAVAEGATVIVLPGYLFGTAVVEAQDEYPDVKFIAVDVGSGDLTFDYVTYYDASANVVCVTFAEEQAGFLAGYAAVKDGYTKLGFLGGMAVPAVVRYGYGFVQGADYAAKEMGVNIEIKYTYGGQFFGDPAITAKMEGWYQAGTQVVFACGGGIYTSALEAAKLNNGKVIGVDVDQGVIDELIITSAMKGLKNVTETLLGEYFAGNWESVGGQFKVYSLNEGDYVGLPTNEATWRLTTFTVEDLDTVKALIMDGTIAIDNSFDTEVTPAVSEFTVVDYIA